MFGKLRKKLKKITKNDPIKKHTAKVLKKTGGPLGKTLSRELMGDKKPARKPGAVSGALTNLGRGNPVGTGGNMRSSPHKTRMGTGGNAPSQPISTAPRPTFKGASGNLMQRLGRRKNLQRQ